MQSRDFCFWLQGFFELSETAGPVSADQAALIGRHLDLVFAHKDFSSLRERPAEAPSPPPVPAPVKHPPQPARETPSKPVEPTAPIEPVRC